ncbi:sodium:proton antiporter [Roseobacter sp. HKCCD9010]|uniref:Na+/H+ antiporter subunit E n=1 Tax=unclassified Roseobacter TaxID=196798 RepID=UPI001492FF77|nr:MULTISPECIES: Na+/H+ antiporter subunit E [unclassified Roseobacter]MBF9048854.1 sodium:proton antiporter [Rhodobacterales bacterium HKCCD4356]NNV10853.1 sodium:proton antiporter [Roseobacter sp. HKCCD7357]NNV15038.1 sodium:proton antiporter [Roseobacter sp. HKCCD8768]NNV24497.1 sodium:proton antiporter [Roseobacter sp. HKCCD8192]NNV28754.1 sodium:proton antiporter [Roseobacter sp. HKCCD9061]
MNIFTLNIVLAVSWAALTGNFTLSGLAIGFLLGSAALYVTRPLYPGSNRYFLRVWRWVRLITMFLYELVVSSIQVVWDVLTPTHHARPGVISMPLDAKGEMEVLLVTNLISLTPGTLSLDVNEDCDKLYIHAMFADDPDEIRRQLKEGMERWVIEAME